MVRCEPLLIFIRDVVDCCWLFLLFLRINLCRSGFLGPTLCRSGFLRTTLCHSGLLQIVVYPYILVDYFLGNYELSLNVLGHFGSFKTAFDYLLGCFGLVCSFLDCCGSFSILFWIVPCFSKYNKRLKLSWFYCQKLSQLL